MIKEQTMAKYKYSDGARGILHFLQETKREDMTYRDLGEQVGKAPRSASAIITSLVKKGLLERVVQEDGAKFVVITEAGLACDPDEMIEDPEEKRAE